MFCYGDTVNGFVFLRIERYGDTVKSAGLCAEQKTFMNGGGHGVGVGRRRKRRGCDLEHGVWSNFSSYTYFCMIVK